MINKIIKNKFKRRLNKITKKMMFKFNKMKKLIIMNKMIKQSII